jgi:hypothetical protein
MDTCFRFSVRRRDGHGRGHNDYAFRLLIAADVVVTVQVALIGVSDFKSADMMVMVEVTSIRVPELIAAGVVVTVEVAWIRVSES